MSALVRILPSGREFVAEANEPLLQAALRSGVALEFGCVNGTCGECKARVKQGEVRQVRFHDYVMTEAEKQDRTVLLCSCTAETDVTIEAAEAAGPGDIPLQKVRARLYRQERVAEKVAIVHLRVMRGRILRFLAGQHARLTLAGADAGDISIASCPCDGLNLEFHFDLNGEDGLSARASAGFAKTDRFEIEGPRGRFTLDERSDRPLVFIASGTAVAAVKSIIEHAVNLELPQPMRLYWQAAREHGHYLHNYFRSLADALDEFHYAPIQGAMSAEVLSQMPEPAAVDAYLAGGEAFVAAVEKLLLERGLPEERLFADALSRRPSSAATAG